MIEMPLDELLAIADRDLKKNQAAFAEAARQIDPKRTPMEVLKTVEADHPPPEKLLATTQAELDALGRFMTEKRIITIPNAPPARVEETPPFMRATTSASMDIPGPFETVATEAYYNMTLPDPKLTRGREERVHDAVVLRDHHERLGARSLAGTLPAVSLRPQLSVGHPQGLRRGDQQRGVGALLRADGHRRRLSRRRSAGTGSRRSRMRFFATPASSSASACTRRA